MCVFWCVYMCVSSQASDVLTQGDDAFATIERLLLSAQQANAASMAVEAAAQNGTGAPGSASDPSQASAQQPVEGDSAQSTLSSTLSVVTGAGGSVSVPTPPSGLLSAAFQVGVLWLRCTCHVRAGQGRASW